MDGFPPAGAARGELGAGDIAHWVVRQRAVLAVLLLHAGSVVSMDALIDDLWGAESPPTAKAVVQNAISRLRKTLGREVIETRAPGYVLHADPGAIDARRFERLVGMHTPCRRSRARPRCATRSALWRGPPSPISAFESFLQDEIARLDELRLTALEDRLDAEIQLGRHDAVIAEASALAAQHAARERLSRLLMLALNRAGRQQDALDAYEAIRRSLDELWGLEPSAETRALQVMILTQDPAIAPTPTVPPSIARDPPSRRAAPRRADARRGARARGGGVALDEARSSLADVVARHGGSLSPESGRRDVAAFGRGRRAKTTCSARRERRSSCVRSCAVGRSTHASQSARAGCSSSKADRCWSARSLVRTRRALHDADPDEILVTPAAVAPRRRWRWSSTPRTPARRHARATSGDGRACTVRRTNRGARRVALRVRSGRRDWTAASRGSRRRGGDREDAPRLRGDRGPPGTVLDAACVPYGEGITFLPLRELAERARAADAGAPELAELTAPTPLLVRPRLARALHGVGAGGRRPRRRALGCSDLPRPRRVRRPCRRGSAARRVDDAAGAHWTSEPNGRQAPRA